MILLNAFSVGMLPAHAKVTFRDVTLDQARAMIDVAQKYESMDSAVGHADTAAVFSTLLGIPVPMNRVSVVVPERVYGAQPWTALIGQYSGPRLPEGATELPAGAAIRWVAVWIE